MINHGTRSGYYAHRRLEEQPCDECRKAINTYLREYRAGKGKDRNRSREKTRRRALSILRERHQEEYKQIVRDLLQEDDW